MQNFQKGEPLTPAPLSPTSPLKPARMHECFGPSALGFAACAAGAAHGKVLWIAHQRDLSLFPLGLAPFCDPECLTLVRASSGAEVLACAEDALRVGACGLIVAQPNKAINLVEGRRLQLAAQTGQTTCLLLINEGQGSNASETRWYCEPLYAKGDIQWQWRLVKNKSGPLLEWRVEWDAQNKLPKRVS